MKKTLFMAALVLMSAGCLAQKANVKKAKSIALNTESADFTAARQLIGEAIQNPETANQAETYYVAGLIGYQENTAQNVAAVLSGTVDQAKCGMAITESYDYWVKADELAMIPTLDKKGREVVDTKTRNNINKKMLEYWKNQNFIQYGLYLNEQRDFTNAYYAFMKHLEMPYLPMMQDPKLQAQMPKDTTYYQYMYYTGLFAMQAQMHREAVAIFEQLKDGEIEPVACNQFLFQEYQALNDTVNFVRVLTEAMNKFPQEVWFMQNLINHYLFSGQADKAMTYLNEAIEREPNVAQYHYIKGNLCLNNKDFDTAMAEFNKTIELDPQMVDAVAGQGRVYYNQAVIQNEEAANILDSKAYKAALQSMNETYKKSLPYFEKAHEMAPEDRDYMMVLRGLYYRFGMDDKYNAINEELNK